MDYGYGMYGNYQSPYSYRQQQQTIVKVNGENGARAYQIKVAPAAILLNTELLFRAMLLV